MLSSILQEFHLRSVESRAIYFNVHIIFLGMWSDQYLPFVFSQVSKCSPLVDSLTRKYIYFFQSEIEIDTPSWLFFLFPALSFL